MPPDNEALIALVAVTLTLAGCDGPRLSPSAEARFAQQGYDRAYDRCMYRVTGPFAGASVEVMRECQRQAQEGTKP